MSHREFSGDDRTAQESVRFVFYRWWSDRTGYRI